jgi:hypothetical protein
MYTAVLLMHSWLRWVVIIAALLVFVRGARAANSTTRLFSITLDIQLLLGLLLYFALSPLTQGAMQNMGEAMRDPIARFWAVEHLTGMLIAVVLAHVGRVRMRRAADDDARYKIGALFVALALVAILLSIPWPWMDTGRPLFQLG